MMFFISCIGLIIVVGVFFLLVEAMVEPLSFPPMMTEDEERDWLNEVAPTLSEKEREEIIQFGR